MTSVRDQVANCAAQGMTMSESARKLGINHSTIKYWQEKLGLTFRAHVRPSAAKTPRVGGKPTLDRAPWEETGPDARRETEPRHRRMISIPRVKEAEPAAVAVIRAELRAMKEGVA
ncbi:MerR family transcriptional regulator [Paracoccus sp. PAR01]|uniref:MerR family transcriptional regulator n=1 Tax=Paracoccus sp. PAR01 TaxID=2769282 RepID=UPI001786767B|nr:MerR family transcriptional regulator [Paracoccus sp. PAR01]MBD9528411.1 MerR family transcriptional regulator [Paracoccus sp. PAR01]